MTADTKSMSCEEFQSQLAELIGSGVDVSNDPHLKSCPLCRELLNDLQTIADAAHEFFANQQPANELWKKIELAIKDEESIAKPK